MKCFSPRERRIIAAVYRDCERICAERWSEQRHGEPTMNGDRMAQHLAMLCGTRRKQILEWNCDLPYNSPRWVRSARKRGWL
jgi:hypothetical protein